MSTACSEASLVVSDDVHAGVSAQRIAKLVGGKGAMLLVAQPGIPAVEHCIKGFEQRIKAYPDSTVLPIQFGNADPERAASIVSATLARNPDLAAICSESPLAVPGTITALRQAGDRSSLNGSKPQQTIWTTIC